MMMKSKSWTRRRNEKEGPFENLVVKFLYGTKLIFFASFTICFSRICRTLVLTKSLVDKHLPNGFSRLWSYRLDRCFHLLGCLQ